MWVRCIAVAVALVACGPSSGQIKEAREASYRVDGEVAFDNVLRVADEQHGIAEYDEDLRVLFTFPRWYTKDGANAGRGTEDQPTNLEDGMVRLAFEAKVVGYGGPVVTVSIKPVAARLVSWSSQLQPVADGDMPYWVQDKLDSFYLAVHARLKEYAEAAE